MVEDKSVKITLARVFFVRNVYFEVKYFCKCVVNDIFIHISWEGNVAAYSIGKFYCQLQKWVYFVPRTYNVHVV